MLIGKDTQSRPPTLRRRQSNLNSNFRGISSTFWSAAELRKSKLTLKLQHANEADSDNASTKEQNQDLCSGKKLVVVSKDSIKTEFVIPTFTANFVSPQQNLSAKIPRNHFGWLFFCCDTNHANLNLPLSSSVSIDRQVVVLKNDLRGLCFNKPHRNSQVEWPKTMKFAGIFWYLRGCMWCHGDSGRYCLQFEEGGYPQIHGLGSAFCLLRNFIQFGHHYGHTMASSTCKKSTETPFKNMSGW